MRLSGTLNWLRVVLALSAGLSIGALIQYVQLALKLGVIPSSWKWTSALIAGGVVALVGSGAFTATWTRAREQMLLLLVRAERILARAKWRWLCPLVFLLSLPIFPSLTMGQSGVYLRGFLIRSFLVWCLILPGAFLLRATFRDLRWPASLYLSAVAHGVVYRLTRFIPDFSTFPFSLGYSEGSRYYFASLFHAGRLYHLKDVDWPILHPSRYLLQSIPFLISGLPLWAHRLWQISLWIGMTTLTAFVLTRRLKIEDRVLRWIWMGWAILFLFQGPVYYHLLIMVVLVLWGTRPHAFLWTSGIVLAASIWAGISRLNWIPVPALLASSLYFLEIPQRSEASLLRYLSKPFLWFSMGTAVGLGSMQVYGRLASSSQDWLNSIQDSPLLWYRLLPNATYTTGVLPAFFIATLPALLLFTSLRRTWLEGISGIRCLALGSILGVLALGGLLVSVKIGGGDDLHNMDAFLVHLMVLVSYVFFARHTQEKDPPQHSSRPSWGWMALLIAVPIGFSLGLGGPYRPPDPIRGRQALADLDHSVRATSERGGQVLFISERHLLTFNLIEGLPLIPEYEKTFLMEMAMSSNVDFFQQFEADLEHHRFDLIVVDPQHQLYRGPDDVFGEEDNAWIEHVSVPLLDYYESEDVIDTGKGRIAIMAPKSKREAVE
jgi:hypothetical protein